MRFAATLLLLLFCSAASAFKMEAGSFTVASTFGNANFTIVNFQQTYDAPPLVFVLPTEQGSDATDIRIRNVKTLGFEAVQAEPPGNDGPHAAMNLQYFAIESGNHSLPGGVRMQAGSFSTQTVQHGTGVAGAEDWDDVTFPVPFSGQAAVVAQIQTMNTESGIPPSPAGPSQPWLATGMQDVTASGFEAALERAEVADGSVLLDETYAWVAMQAGASATFDDTGGSAVLLEALRTPRSVDGWDNGCDSYNFQVVNSGNRVAVASQNSHFGGDGGWVRRCALTNISIGFTIDEDIFRDSERAHTTEEVAALIFDRSFVYDDSGTPDIVFMKLVDAVISDPVNSTANPKAIPGAVLQYRVNASNQGDGQAENVVLSDPVPQNTALFIGNVGGPNSGPIVFSDGATASGLTYSYSVITPTTDDLEFSDDDASTWDYQPTGDADGFDAAVTHFRINFGGQFAPLTAPPAPSFDVRFRVRVDQ